MDPNSSSVPTTPSEEPTNPQSIPVTVNQSSDVSPAVEPAAAEPIVIAPANFSPSTAAPAAFINDETPSEPSAVPSEAAAEAVTPAEASVVTSTSPTVIAPTESVPLAPAASSASDAAAVPAFAAAQAVPATSLPVIGQPVVNGTPGVVPPVGYNLPKTGGKPRWLLPVAVVAALVVLGGGFVFGYYIPNQPSAIFSKSLTNSGQAVDRLVSFTKTQSVSPYATASFDGKINVKSAQVSGDATITGAVDKNGNGNLKINADIAGSPYTAELRSIKKASNDSPDIYLQATGFKSILDAQGMSTYDSLDGQWISVDHTLIDMYKKSIESASGTSAAQMPTQTQINDALVKVQTVNKQYLFSTSKDTAVLVNKKFVAKEKMDGRTVDHFTTGYNKDHLVAYVKAIKSAFDSSSLPKTYKTTYDSAFDQMSSGASASNGSFTFDMYADTSSKLVHAVTFTDPSQGGAKVTITQNYTSGDDYPFALDLESKSGGQTQSVKMSFSFNSKTYKETASLNANIDGMTATGQFSTTSSNTPVTVVAPTSSKPVTDILNQLGLGFTNSSGMPLAASSSSPFTLSQ